MAYPTIGGFSAPGYQGIYIPGYMGDGETQRRLMVGFTLNEEDFPLNNYISVFPTDVPKFFYNRWNSADAVRVPFGSGDDERWADGAERPRDGEEMRMIAEAVEVFRYGKTSYLGEMAQDLSRVGNLLKINQNVQAGKNMLRRSIQTQTALTDSTNYPTTGTKHYYATWTALAADAVTQGYPANYFGVSGTNFAADGTINDPLLGKALSHGVKQILKRSNGRVGMNDLCILMNPNTADRLKNAQEIRAYMAQQAGSIEVLKGQNPKMWPTFGIPDPLYGLKIIVDGTVKVTSKQDHVNNDTQDFVVGDGLLSIIARPGSVQGMPESEAFGSLALWQHKKYAMKAETFADTYNHRIAYGVSDMFAVKLVAPEITFTIANCFG